MPADLHKQSDKDVSPLVIFEMKLEAWVNAHAPILFVLTIITLMVLIVVLIATMMAVYGGSPTGTEANIWFNHMERII